MKTKRTPNALMLAVLTLGPVLTVLFLAAKSGSTFLHPSLLPQVLIGALLVWSPLPMALPALILQDARDSALPTTPAAVRAVTVVPHLALSDASPVRAEMRASLAGFVIAVAAALPYIGA